MVNDTTTLNGALQELGETMAANLTQQGVTSSASEGLTTLAGKILDIQTGGGSCYHIEFSEDSYTAVGGSATLEIMLQENYAPKVGATVSVVGSDSSLYSGITNNEGIAQVTVSNISGTVSFTCSYSNVSAQCTVTAGSQVLFYDACDSTYKSSEYGTIIKVSSSTTTNYTAYDSGQNAYLTRANGDWGCIPILALTGKDNYKLSAYFKPRSTSTHIYRCGFGFLEQNTTTPFYNFRIQGNGELSYSRYTGSEQDQNQTFNLNVTNYHKMEIIKQGNNYTFNWYDTDDTTILKTISKTIALTNPVVGLYLVGGSNYGGYVKEIKAESL